jgi:hypothetical protein
MYQRKPAKRREGGSDRPQDAHARRGAAFLAAAAAYFGGVAKAGRPGEAILAAVSDGSLDPDRRVALDVCLALAFYFDDVREKPSISERETFDELRAVITGAKRKAAASAIAVDLVAEHARMLSPEPHATDDAIAATLVVELAANVDRRLGTLRTRAGIDFVVERLHKFHPKPKGHPGALGAAAIFAHLCIRTNALGHNAKGGFERARKDIEENVRKHHRKRRTTQ